MIEPRKDKRLIVIKIEGKKFGEDSDLFREFNVMKNIGKN
jgi:hypothetical protein